MTRRRLLDFGLVVSTAASLVLFSSCGFDAGGDSAGFCRRWDKVLDEVQSNEIDSTGDLLDAISASNLGDPGGDLSTARSRFESAIRHGSTAEATSLTNRISELCAEISD